MATLELQCSDTGSGAPIILLHGFTTHSAAWDGIAGDLAPTYRVLRIDLPGHGRSPAPPAGYDFNDCTRDLLEALDRRGVEKCTVLGYSMGGRIALAMAAAFPHRIDRLILESASPGIADPEQRSQRAHADHNLAGEIESQPFEGFIDRWMAQPLFASQRKLSAAEQRHARKIRLSNRPAAIAAALRALGSGSQPSYWDQLRAMEVPVLVINGETDEKFDAIARDMHALLPASTRRVIRDAGHTTHLENAPAFVECIRAFLRSSGQRSHAAYTGHG